MYVCVCAGEVITVKEKKLGDTKIEGGKERKREAEIE